MSVTSDMYGHGDTESVNKARYRMFVTNCKASTSEETFQTKLRNLDATSFPPCQRELYQQILRANYITSIWKNAYLTRPTTLNAEGSGWIIQDNKYEFVWFDGEQLPKFTPDVILQPEDEDGMGNNINTQIISNAYLEFFCNIYSCNSR